MTTPPSSVAGSLEPVAFTRPIFKLLKAELARCRNWQIRRQAEIAPSNTSTASTTRAESTQPSAGNHPGLRAEGC